MTDRPVVDDPDVGSSMALGPDPAAPGAAPVIAGGVQPAQSDDLLYVSGLEVQARSQWWYARHRFLRHRLAMGSLVVLVIVFGAGIFANHLAPYSYSISDFNALAQPPSLAGKHFFGTDQIGRDYFSRTLYGIRTSEEVAIVVALVGTFLGVMVGAFSGYFGGWVDNLLMRLTDFFLVLPLLAVLLTVASLLGHQSPLNVAFIIGVLLWPSIARIVRGSFLSLKEKEYVEAAKASGSGDLRIMVRHILPNSIGPIVVAATLLTGVAILTEAVLSFLGFGVQPPTPALGELISDGQSAGLNLWWLVTFPGLTIVLIILCINFIGDGLRDALDPTQRRIRA